MGSEMCIRDSLEEALARSKHAHRSSLDTIGTKLSEKTHELNSSQLEADQLRAEIASLEGRLKVAETAAQSKVAAIEAELGQLRATLNQQEAMASEYRARVWTYIEHVLIAGEVDTM